MDVALGLAKQPNVSTRGWFRLDPGQCRPVIDGTLDADLVYVHARTPPIYGSAPTPKRGSAAFCVRKDNFDLADGRNCPLSQQVPFSPARPSESDNGPVVNLAEDAGYDDAQARLAGIQRLLTIAGYDASPIDGVDGSKTQGALKAFSRTTSCRPTRPRSRRSSISFWRPRATRTGAAFPGATTPHIRSWLPGLVEMGAIVTRGWYRVPAHGCLRPDLAGDPHRLYSYAEAVDGNGRAIARDGKPLSWGGKITLCTQARQVRDQQPQELRRPRAGSAGFAAVDVGGKPSMTLHLKEPSP